MLQPCEREDRRRRDEHRAHGVPRPSQSGEGDVRRESGRDRPAGVPGLREPPELHAARHDTEPLLPLLRGLQQGADGGDDSDEQGRDGDETAGGGLCGVLEAGDGYVRRHGEDAHRRFVCAWLHDFLWGHRRGHHALHEVLRRAFLQLHVAEDDQLGSRH